MGHSMEGPVLKCLLASKLSYLATQIEASATISGHPITQTGGLDSNETGGPFGARLFSDHLIAYRAMPGGEVT